MVDLTEFIDMDETVRITCIDGQTLEGRIGAVEDEEESELGEIGLTLYTPDGGYYGIGQSEIESIEIENINI